MTQIQNRFSTHLSQLSNHSSSIFHTDSKNETNPTLEHSSKTNNKTTSKTDSINISKSNKASSRMTNISTKIAPVDINSLFPTIEPLHTFHPDHIDYIYHAENYRKKRAGGIENNAKSSSLPVNAANGKDGPQSTAKGTSIIRWVSYPRLKVDDGMDELMQVRYFIQKFEAYMPEIGVKQPVLKDQLLQALSFLVQALHLLKGQEKIYGNIIVDLSMHIWNACKRTAREGARQWVTNIWGETFLSLEKVLLECGASSFLKEWTIQCGIQYILALDDAKQTDQALKEFGRISDIISGKSLSKGKGTDVKVSDIQQSLSDNVFRLQLHLGRHGKKAGSAPKDTNQKYLQFIQLAKSKMFDDSNKIMKELQDILTAMKKELGCEGNLSEQKISLQLKALPEDKLLIAGELALITSHYGWTQLSKEAIALASASKSLHTTILCDYAKANLIIHDIPTLKRDKLTTNIVQTRLKAISIAEKALLNAKNLDPIFSGDVLLMGCIMIWNFCLPLLNTNLINQVKRPLSQLVMALEEYDVQHINELRAKILLELANCNIAEDVLTKAYSNINQALTLDYIAQESEIERFGLLRPLDRYLLPHKQHLDLKLDVYKSPETPEDEAYLLLEQAKEAKDVNLRKTLLERAFHTIHSSSLLEEAPKTFYNGYRNEESYSLYRLKERFILYSQCAKLAWNGNFKIVSIAQSVGRIILNPETWNHQKWTIERDLEVFIDLALVNLIIAESFIVQLQQEGLELHTICDDDDPEGEKLIFDAENALQEHIKRALQIGLDCKQLWIVENCCIYLWNYHLSIFQDRKEFYPSLGILSDAHNALISFGGQISGNPKDKVKPKDSKATVQSTSMERVDSIILCRITYAYSCALLQKFSIEKKGESLSFAEHLDTIYSLSNASNSNNDILKRVHEVLESSISYISAPMLSKDLIYLRAKIQRLMTDKIPSILAAKDVSISEKLLSYIEVLKQPIPELEKVKLVEEASGLISSSQEAIPPEIICWLSFLSLQQKQYRHTVQIGEKSIENISENEDTGAFTPRMWRWYSLIILNQAQSILQFIDPKNQNQTTQINLRKEALEKLINGTKCASKSGDMNIGFLLCKSCVACVKGLMSQSSIRKSIAASLISFMKSAQFIKMENAYQVLEQLYIYTFKCIRDTAVFNNGITLVKTALSHLPPSFHKNIWKYDVEFRSRSENADVRSSINRVSGYSPEMQATVFSLVGQFSKEPQLQKECYLKAINILKEKQSIQVHYMLQYAVWLYVHESPHQEVIDLLMACADILNSMDHIEDMNGDASEVNSVISSRSGLSKRTSVASTRSQHSRRSVTQSNISRRSMRSIKSKQQNDNTKEETGPISFAQLDSLCMVYTLLSMTAQTSEERYDYAMTAHFYYMRILKSGFEYANNYNMKKGESQIKHNKEESTPSIIYHQLPNVLDDWIDFNIPEDVVNLWNQSYESLDENALNTRPTVESKIKADLNEFIGYNQRYAVSPKNLFNPQQSFHLLDDLLEYLLSEGYYTHCIPLIHLKEVYGSKFDHPDTFKKLINLQFAYIMDKLSFKEKKDYFRNKAADLSIPAYILREQEEIHEILIAERSGSKTSKSSTLRYREAKLLPLQLRHMWKEQARYLIEGFELTTAIHLLEFSLKDAIAHDDFYVYSQCNYYLSRIYLLQGNFKAAIKYSSIARSEYECEMQFVTKCLITTFEALYHSGETRVADALFKDSHQVYSAMLSQCPTNIEVIILVAEFEYKIAKVLIQMNMHEKQCIELLKNAHSKMREHNSNSSLLAQLSLDYAQFLLERSFTVSYSADEIVTPQLNLSEIESSLLEAISILENNKLALQAIISDMIPPGSSLSNRYPCSKLLSQNLILLGKSLSLLHLIQHAIAANEYLRKKNDLTENILVPKMEDTVNDDTLYEATRKFMIQASIENMPTISNIHLEKSISLFTTAFNLTISPQLRCESDLLIAQCLRMLHHNDMNSDIAAPIILSHLEKAFLESLKSENWYILALTAFELADIIQDEKLSAKYTSFAQASLASMDILKQYKELARVNVSENAIIRLFETMKRTLPNPFQSDIFMKVYEKLKDNSLVFSTLSPASVLQTQNYNSSKEIVESIPRIWPNSESDSFVNLVVQLSPPPPANVSSINRYAYAAVILNDDIVIDPKKKSSNTSKTAGKAKIENEELQNLPTRFFSKVEIDIENIVHFIQDYQYWKRSLTSRTINIDETNQEFQKLIERANTLLSPLLEPLEETLEFYSKKGASKLILTLDPTLQNIPWEVLTNSMKFSTISRDFSSIFITSRIFRGSTSTLDANWNSISYTVDPFSADSSNEFLQLKTELTTKKYTLNGIHGFEYHSRNEKPHVSEFQQILCQTAILGAKQDAKKKEELASVSKGTFLYVGPNILDWVGSDNLASLRLQGINTMLLFDKEEKESEFVNSLDASTILSLRGVSSIITNQYLTSIKGGSNFPSDDYSGIIRAILEDPHHKMPNHLIQQMTNPQKSSIGQLLQELRQQSNNHFVVANTIIIGLP